MAKLNNLERYATWSAIGENARPFLEGLSLDTPLTDIATFLLNNCALSPEEAHVLNSVLLRFGVLQFPQKRDFTELQDLMEVANRFTVINPTSTHGINTNESGIGPGLAGFIMGSGLRRSQPVE